MGVVLTFFFLLVLSSFLSPSLEDGSIYTEILSQRAVNPKTTNQPNPVVSDMRTPVYSCYHVYSKVSDKNACRSKDSDLTTNSTILDSISDTLSLYEICITDFPLVVSQRKLVTRFQFLFHSAFYFL